MNSIEDAFKSAVSRGTAEARGRIGNVEKAIADLEAKRTSLEHEVARADEKWRSLIAGGMAPEDAEKKAALAVAATKLTETRRQIESLRASRDLAAVDVETAEVAAIARWKLCAMEAVRPQVEALITMATEFAERARIVGCQVDAIGRFFWPDAGITIRTGAMYQASAKVADALPHWIELSHELGKPRP